MKRNCRIMQAGLGIMLSALLLCLGFDYFTRLKNPVFLNYCIEASAVSFQGDGYRNLLFEIQYFTNSEDKRQVEDISFQEAPEMDFLATEMPSADGFQFMNPNQTPGITLGKYSLRTIYIYQSNNFREDWEGEKELKTAVIRFNNGSLMTVDLGKLILYSDPPQEGAIDGDSAIYHDSSMYKQSSVFRVSSRISLISLSSPFMEEASFIEMKVDNSEADEIAGRIYDKNDNIAVDTVINTGNNIEMGYDVYNIVPRLNYKDTAGAAGYVRIHGIHWERSFHTLKDALSYLKERGAI